MVIKIKKKIFLKPTKNEWESRAVFNPTVIKEKQTTHMIYRAVSSKTVSYLGYAKIKDNKIERNDNPLILPTKNYEISGVEDPRLTKIGKTYYLLYTAYDGKTARIAYAVSKNLKDWEKKGIISPQILVKKAIKLVKIKKYKDTWIKRNIFHPSGYLWDKDAILLPEKIRGKYVMIHRLAPDIQIVKFKDFSELQDNSFWENYIKNLEDHVIMQREYTWESELIGGGAVPIKTKQGWLFIYHGIGIIPSKLLPNSVQDLFRKFKLLKKQRRYSVGAALLELKYPEREITRLSRPLFKPELEWEKKGHINNVVFPEGTIIEKNKLKIYYGASDSVIGLAEINFKQLMEELKSENNK